MPITIKELASILGVSPGTISKALNNKKDIGEELKNKILEAAKQYGYSPNPIARRLSTHRSHMIGVFILCRHDLHLQESMALHFLDGIADGANHYNYDILLFTVTRDTAKRSYMELCKQKRVEGAIFIGLTNDDPYLEELKHSDIPIAVIDYDLGGRNSLFITTDNVSGIEQGIQYLLDMNHREIGFIKACNASEVSNVRFHAFKNFLDTRGLFNSSYVWSGDFSKESGYKIGRVIAAMEKRPTALFFAGDWMAIGAMQALKEAGMQIPQDISILGFDNVLHGEWTEPALSTIGQDGFSMGKAAFCAIWNWWEKDKKAEAARLKPELILRKSVSMQGNHTE